MLRYFKYIMALAAAAIVLLSCERVITVDIKDITPRFVVEGILTDDSTCRVRLSTTSNFNDTVNLIGISNAHVTISEDGKPAVRLTPTSISGIYRTAYSGQPGHTYHLRVEFREEKTGELKIFTASSQMPQKVKLDSLYITDRVFLGKQRKIATMRYKDPPGLGNAYRFIQYVDGEEETTIFVTKDDLINGRIVIDELLIFDDKFTLKKCDQVHVELQCIDLPNYLFWYSLNQSSLGASQSASPGNPASNIRGGALGHFSAHTVSVKNIAILPDSTCSYPAD